MYSSITYILIVISIIKTVSTSTLIPLTIYNSFYYITIFTGSQKKQLNLLIDTSIPSSLIANPLCSICTSTTFDPNQSKTLTPILLNHTIMKNYQAFTGSLYQDTYSLIHKEHQSMNFSFISFTNLTYTERFSTTGYFSLSYTNSYLNNSFGIFALSFQEIGAYLELGNYNEDLVSNKTLLQNFTVNINNTDNLWYINFSTFQIFNKVFSEENIKLIFDTSTWIVSIPRDFFFNNLNLILPSGCQVELNGIFHCTCSANYYNEFPSFTFFNENGNTIFIDPHDYVRYTNAPFETVCVVYIRVNYESDYWIIGLNGLTKYYSIFDIRNKMLMLYPKGGNLTEKDYVIMLSIIFGISILFIYASFCLYKKCVTSNMLPPPDVEVIDVGRLQDDNNVSNNNENNAINDNEHMNSNVNNN